jgi:2-methylcitrate dehydratase PrpD
MYASEKLAHFAVNLSLDSVPPEVLRAAKSLVIDTVGVASYGSLFPWSQSILRFAQATSAAGHARLFGVDGVRMSAPQAALCNGAFSHAFEQDSLRKPGAGVHPGATVLAPAWAVAEECDASGANLLKAVIAGCEVMFRIGAASLHSSEKKGFHAPGLTGPYGSAVASGLLLGLNESQMVSALGIAGSLSAGLMAFTKSNQGSDVKRLHLGRAAEAGVVAAMLAKEGLDGPETILEGRFGFLEAYCDDSNAELLTTNLGSSWETSKTCLKAFPCHITAHTPIESLRVLMGEHRFIAEQVAQIHLEVSEKVLSHHVIREPSDIKQAQYSTPFCVAWALHHDPYQPGNMNDAILHDELVRQTCRDIQLSPFSQSEKKNSAWSSLLRVTLKSGKVYELWSDEFLGSPNKPLNSTQLQQRFFQLTEGCLNKEQWWIALNSVQDLASLRDLPDLIYSPDME